MYKLPNKYINKTRMTTFICSQRQKMNKLSYEADVKWS